MSTSAVPPAPLAGSAQQFMDLVQGIDAIVWEMDVATYRFTFVNQRAEHLLGYPVHRWLEEPTFWRDVLLHPDDREWAFEFCQSATRDVRDHEFDYRALRADGEVVWLRDRVRVVRDEAGQAHRLRGVMFDVSEEKKGLAALSRREAQLAEAQALARIGSWEVQLDTGTITWSDELYRLCGLEPQSVALTTETFLALIHPDDRGPVRRAVERAAAAAEPYCMEARILRGDGSVRHAQIRGEAVTDRHGRIVGLRGTGQDITERRLAEAARRRAEQDARTMSRRMRAVAGAAAGVIGAGSVEALQGVLREECRRVMPFDAFAMALYDRDSHTLAYLEGYDADIRIPARTVPAAGTPGERVIRTRRSLVTGRAADPDAAGARPIGTGRRSESIIRTPILGGDRVLGLLSVQSYTPDLYTDQDLEVLEAVASLAATALLNLELLAELRASEESYRTIFEASHDAIYVHDLETGALIDVNRRCHEMHGYSRDELLGLGVEGVADGTPPYDAAHAAEYLRRAAAGEPQRFEWLARHRDGGAVWADVYLHRVSIGGGDRILATARDITERKAIDARLLRLNEELEQRVAERTAELQQRSWELEAIFRALPDIYFRFAADGTVLDHRANVDDRLLLPPELFLGRTLPEILRELVPADVGARLQRALEEVNRTGRLVCVEYPMIVNGSECDFEARMLPVEDGSFIAVVRDVTDRKRAERELERREEHFRRLIEGSYDVLMVVGLDATISYISPSIERILGYSPAELFGESGIGLLHPDDVALGVEKLDAAAAGALAPTAAEFRLRHSDGSYRLLESFARTLNADSPADGIVINARDITERKQFEDDLRDSEARYRSLIENAHDIVTITDAAGRIGYQSPQLQRVLGYGPDETVGRLAIDFVHPDDRPRTEAAMAEIVASPGATAHNEYRFRHKDGSWRYLETFGRTLLPESVEAGVVFNTRDVTARRAAERALHEREEHFRKLIETSHDLIQTLDREGRIVYTGPSVQRLLGYAPEELTGGAARDYIHPDDQPLVESRIVEAMANPGQIVHVEYRVLHKDGRWRWFEAMGRTLSPETAEHGMVANARDITERRHAEEALARARDEAERAREAAERANRAKSEFLSRMSHELRTPMNSILGFAQLLDRAALPPEHRKGVGHILKAGRHLLQLINEVLEIARIEAGRHSLSLEPVRLGTVLQEAVALVRPLAAQWRVDLDDGPWPCCAVYVEADRQRLTQVLLNLLGNAIKYNRAGGRVRVGCESLADGERPRLVVRVEDTGRGIPRETAHQLFTPFARLGAEQGEVEGTGLGLALSQRLTEAMGGSLTLQSTGAEGSVFRLELQVTADPLHRLEDPVGAPAALDGVPHAPATLLYIEDNLANLSLVETILLSRPGWRTMPALQGQIGVELAREHTPDLILLDLHLPDISGEEVLRRLRTGPRTASIPVVVITADATRTTVDRLRAAGADAYLTKPLDVDEFLETVERFLPGPE